MPDALQAGTIGSLRAKSSLFLRIKRHDHARAPTHASSTRSRDPQEDSAISVALSHHASFKHSEIWRQIRQSVASLKCSDQKGLLVWFQKEFARVKTQDSVRDLWDDRMIWQQNYDTRALTGIRSARKSGHSTTIMKPLVASQDMRHASLT